MNKLIKAKDGRVLWEDEAASVIEAITSAIKANVSLANANFTGATIINSTIRGAKLRDATFFAATIKQTKFIDCDLDGVNFGAANLEDVEIVNEH
jgi:uncharacterized protein YjbI with pentapeptide repeats